MNKNWTELNSVLSDNESAEQLAESPTFSIFEDIFISEIKRLEDEANDDLFVVASRILDIHRHVNSSFQLSPDSLESLAKYLFDKHPDEAYAKFLVNDPVAKSFLEKKR